MADVDSSSFVCDDDIQCAQPEVTKRGRDDEGEEEIAKRQRRGHVAEFQDDMNRLVRNITHSLERAPEYEDQSIAVVADVATLSSLRGWCDLATEVAVATALLSDGAAITQDLIDAMKMFTENATEISKAASIAENASVHDHDAPIRLPLFSHSRRCAAALEELVTAHNTVLAHALAKARAEDEEEVEEVVVVVDDE